MKGKCSSAHAMSRGAITISPCLDCSRKPSQTPTCSRHAKWTVDFDGLMASDQLRVSTLLPDDHKKRKKRRVLRAINPQFGRKARVSYLCDLRNVFELVATHELHHVIVVFVVGGVYDPLFALCNTFFLPVTFFFPSTFVSTAEWEL